jgi:hypothetical protein
MRDYKTTEEPEVGWFSSGCGWPLFGLVVISGFLIRGILFGIATYRGTWSIFTQFNSLDFLMVLLFIPGVSAGVSHARKLAANVSTVPPEVDEAARTHFNPTTQQPGSGDGPGPDAGIKQPDGDQGK